MDVREINAPIAKRVRWIFDHSGLTARQFGAAVGVSTGTMWNWFQGEHAPTPRSIVKIAGWLGVETDVVATFLWSGSGRATIARALDRLA